MLTRFFASQSVNLSLAGAQTSVADYLQESQRIVTALMANSKIDPLSPHTYRLSMRPLRFMMLSIQPVVDMEVTTTTDGTLVLQSTHCILKGLQSFNPQFELNLRGELTPVRSTPEQTYLAGQAQLEVKVDLPQAFQFTPRTILEGTGNSLLRSILGSVRHRLENQLPRDYLSWKATEQQAESASRLTQEATSRWR